VDEIVMRFHDMELDIPGPKDERTLREVLGGFILWDKNYIKLLGSAPRTTPPPSLKEICPRGNNNIVIIIFLVHDNVYIPC
jgi:hypothetical protein